MGVPYCRKDFKKESGLNVRLTYFGFSQVVKIWREKKKEKRTRVFSWLPFVHKEGFFDSVFRQIHHGDEVLQQIGMSFCLL